MFPCSRMKQESTTTTLSSAAVITASEIIPLFVKNCELIHPALNKPFMSSFLVCFVRFVFHIRMETLMSEFVVQQNV